MQQVACKVSATQINSHDARLLVLGQKATVSPAHQPSQPGKNTNCHRPLYTGLKTFWDSMIYLMLCFPTVLDIKRLFFFFNPASLLYRNYFFSTSCDSDGPHSFDHSWMMEERIPSAEVARLGYSIEPHTEIFSNFMGAVLH